MNVPHCRKNANRHAPRAAVRRLGTARRQRRRGVVLVLFAVVFTVLMGFMGLVVDGGLMLSAQTRAQSAADAAAMAAGHDLYRGRSESVARASALTYVAQHNGMPDANVTVNIPPGNDSAYKNKPRYAEVIVRVPIRTFLIHLLGVDPNQTVTARATGGYEPRAAGEGVMALNPLARPGLKLSGNGSLRVAGRVVVNSQGEGVDEYGLPVDLNGDGSNNNGVAASGGKDGVDFGVFADTIDVVGGVDKPAMFKHISQAPEFSHLPPIDGSALNCRQTQEPDPLIQMPTPTVALGVDPTQRGSVSVQNNNASGVQQGEGGSNNFRAVGGEIIGNGLHVAEPGQIILYPGIYTSLKITGGNVFLIPGIYVLAPQSNSPSSVEVTGGTILGRGVMFYNTASSYNAHTGQPDIFDSEDKSPLENKEYAGDFRVNSGMIITPIDTAKYNYASLYTGARAVSSDFSGMTFYQRRRNTSSLSIQGNAGDGILEGTFYAKWALFNITGQGTYVAQFICGSLELSGNGNVTIQNTGNLRGRASRVFLVE